MGPLVAEEQLDRVWDYVESGFAEGARALTGGRKIDGPGYFIEPTVRCGHMHMPRSERCGIPHLSCPAAMMDNYAAAALGGLSAPEVLARRVRECFQRADVAGNQHGEVLVPCLGCDPVERGTCQGCGGGVAGA
jgi:hypothetical protein